MGVVTQLIRIYEQSHSVSTNTQGILRSPALQIYAREISPCEVIGSTRSRLGQFEVSRAHFPLPA